MWRGFRARDVTDELSDDLGADALVHQDLEVPGPHRRALSRVNRNDALLTLRVEVARHGLEPVDPPERTCEHEHLECLAGIRGQLDCLRGSNIDPVCGLDGESPSRDRDGAGSLAYE